MYHRKAGSATAAEPKFMWIKMLPRKHQHLNKVEFFRYRFNAALENKLASKQGNYIIDLSEVIRQDSFDKDGTCMHQKSSTIGTNLTNKLNYSIKRK